MLDQATHARKDDGESNRVSLPLKRITTAWRSLPGLHGGIGLRLLVRVLLFSSVITLLLTLMQLYLDYRRDVAAIDQRMSEIDSGYRQSLGEGLWRLDARQLQLQAEGILHQPDIRYVELREATNRAAPLVVAVGSHQANPPRRREFRIFYTNHGAEQLVGILVVEATFDGVYRRLLDTAAVILVGQAIMTFIVSFFILLIVHRLITRHLTGIASSLRGYDLHGSQAPLRLDRRRPADELDRLVEAFNDMYARLQAAYGDLAEREARIQRLVDSNIIGIFIWNFEGRILEANDEFLRMVDYDREDLVSGRIRWTDLTPPDWRERDKAKIEQHKIRGRLEPFEKEYTRKDGSRVPVLIGVATFEEGGNEGVAFVLDLTERNRAEGNSRESELKLRQITETVPGLIWSTGPDGEPTHFNQRILDYSGMPSEAFMHGGWEGFVHPADYPETAEAFYHAIQTGTSYERVMRLRRADGEFRWHDARCEPLRDREGRIIQWYGLCVDIDERKKVEDQLRRSEAYLAEAERLSHTGGWAMNRKGERTIVYWSEESYRIFGFDPLQGMPTRDRVWQQVHPDDRSRLREAADAALRQKRDYVAAFRILLPEGTIKYLESNAHHLFSADGELLGVVGTFVDVTERKRADDALRESERNLRSVIDGIAGLVAVLAPNGELESVNRQLLEYFGRSLEWAKDWGTNDMVHPEDRPRAVESFTKAIACGLPYHTDQRLRGADGEYRWFETRGVPIRDDSGRIERWYVLLTDIEDRTRALARLEQMQGDFAHINRVSMMGELAASLSHEITQPIGSARNNARAAMNFLERCPPDISEVREALGCVVGDTDRAGEIIDRIRDHIKKAPPRKRHFDLNEAINEVIVLGRSAIIKNGVSVQTRLSEGLFPIHCDRVQLQQVVLNLILNAAEAMGSVEAEPRELMISTEQHHTGVLVAVRDSGPGIDPTHLERVFEAFYTTKSRGVGMGLSICRSIIDAHGGRLWAEPNEPRGTIFQFTLPAVQVRP